MALPRYLKPVNLQPKSRVQDHLNYLPVKSSHTSQNPRIRIYLNEVLFACKRDI